MSIRTVRLSVMPLVALIAALAVTPHAWAVWLPTSAAMWKGVGGMDGIAVSLTGHKGKSTGKPKQRKQTKPARPAKQAIAPERTPSGETVTDRERRLTRECKGRPNAGACLGYAS